MQLENYFFFIRYSDQYIEEELKGKEDVLVLINDITLEESADIWQALDEEFYEKGIEFKAEPDFVSREDMPRHLVRCKKVAETEKKLLFQPTEEDDLFLRAARSAIMFGEEIVKQRPRLFVIDNIRNVAKGLNTVVEGWYDSRIGPPSESYSIEGWDYRFYNVPLIEHWVKSNISVEYADEFHMHFYSPLECLDRLNLRANEILAKDFKGKFSAVLNADRPYQEAMIFTASEYAKDKNPIWTECQLELNELSERAVQGFRRALDFFRNAIVVIERKITLSQPGILNHQLDDRVAFTLVKDPAADPSDEVSDKWNFLPGKAIYSGKEILLNGIRLKLLKALVDTDGGLTESHLIEAGWGHDQMTESKTVQNHLTKLRNHLRKKLGLNEDFDPIPCVDVCENRAWKLADNLK
jgi:hypothetical protein